MFKPEVIDNFLELQDYKTLVDELTHPEFPWYFALKGDPAQFEGNPHDNFQFVHPMYYDYKTVGDYAHLVGKIIRKLDPYALTRIKVNMCPRSQELIQYDWHTDEENHQGNTAIYYLNTCDGKTIFKEGPEVESVGNRICIFPGDHVHTGTNTTNNPVRVVININYVPKIKK